MPPNPPSKAHGFAMRSMSLRDMQILKSEKKNLPPPCQILGTPLVNTRGAKQGGVGGVSTPPEFWMGGLNTCQPPLILRNIF